MKNYYGSLCTEMYEILHAEAPREELDFQTHLYRSGEMEESLREAGFSSVRLFSSFQKDPAADGQGEMFLFECGR